jgi:hypothetical protein
MYYIRDQFGEIDYGESDPEQSLEEFISLCKRCGTLTVSAAFTDLVIWENETKIVAIIRYREGKSNFQLLEG